MKIWRIGLFVLISVLVDIHATAALQFRLFTTNNYVKTSMVSVQVDLLQGAPIFKTILVNSNKPGELPASSYSSYTSSNLMVDLGGTRDGDYIVWVGLTEGYNLSPSPVWKKIEFTIDTSPPHLLISSPKETTLGTPLVQVKGESDEQLRGLTFSVSNAVSASAFQQGIVYSRFYDTNLWQFTTNYFQCFDIFLTNGLNLISVQAADRAGNTAITNLLLTVDYSIRTNVPDVKITWPQNGFKITAANFTCRGYVDDAMAEVTAFIVNTNGDTNRFRGQIERDGRFWLDNMPLGNGTNYLTISIRDTAGNIATTNLVVIRGSIILDMDPVTPASKLWQQYVDVAGHISDPTCAVWVNGVKGHNNGDGTWSASKVPVSEGGVANFDMAAYEPNEQQPDGSYGKP